MANNQAPRCKEENNMKSITQRMDEHFKGFGEALKKNPGAARDIKEAHERQKKVRK